MATINTIKDQLRPLFGNKPMFSLPGYFRETGKRDFDLFWQYRGVGTTVDHDKELNPAQVLLAV